MNWLDVLLITFSVVAANHLGLVAAVEGVIRHKLPIVNCPKCAAFWSVLAYGCYGIAIDRTSIFLTIAVAFLSAWSAVWIDLIMGIIDTVYIKVYDTLFTTADTTDTDALSATDTMPDVPEGESCDATATNRTKDKEINH